MTHDQDIERVLDRWFSEGPTQMPERFLVDTLDRIDRAPQPRLAGLRTRLPAMHPGLRLAAAAAVVLAVAGVGAGLADPDCRRRGSAAGGIRHTAGVAPGGVASRRVTCFASWACRATDGLGWDIVIGRTIVTI